MHINNHCTPFLKWAGGKRWFASKHKELFPSKFDRYFEPFLGSGAIYFDINPDSGILSDINSELITTYKSIRDNYQGVYDLLLEHKQKHSKEYYYKVRAKKLNDDTEIAARLIYLNRTCWNGLYRVNLKGEFNVPVGTKDSVILETDDFKKTSNALKHMDIECCDFEKTINKASIHDFVFIDPPYTVTHNENNFIKYNQKLFNWDDQIRLKEAIARASERGAKIIATNACHDSLKKLYKDDFHIKETTRQSVLAARSEYRKSAKELIIRNW